VVCKCRYRLQVAKRHERKGEVEILQSTEYTGLNGEKMTHYR